MNIALGHGARDRAADHNARGIRSSPGRARRPTRLERQRRGVNEENAYKKYIIRKQV